MPVAEERAHGRRRRERAQVAVQRVEQRLQREAPRQLVAPGPQHHRPGGRGAGRPGLQDARLADPGLPLEQEDPDAAPGRLFEGGVERLELRPAPQQRLGSRPPGGAPGGGRLRSARPAGPVSSVGAGSDS